MPEQASARAVVRPGDTPEVAALHSADAVMQRQSLVQERVIGPQQIKRAAILAQDAFEEQFCLAAKSLPQGIVEIGKVIGRRSRERDVAQEQPLSGEVLNERFRTRIGQHALHLSGEDARSPELVFHRQLEQLVVGDAAPQKNESRDASSRSVMR